jgi:regulator of RNase E activity RraA
MLPGLRIQPAPALAPTHLVEAFRDVVTPHISDSIGRHIGARGLKRYNQTGKLVGTALTVKTRPGDNLFIYKAMTCGFHADSDTHSTRIRTVIPR